MRNKKYICKYREGKKVRRVTFTATGRGIAILGLFELKNIEAKNIISLKEKK